MKALRASILVLVLCFCAYAGNMDNGVTGNTPNEVAGNMDNGVAGNMDNGVAASITEIALNLLQSVIPLI